MTAFDHFPGVLALLAISACFREAPTAEPGARQAIAAAVTRYVAASNRGDADALTEMYAEDAVLLPPDHEPIEGREAIGAFWRKGTDQGLEVTTIRIDTDGRIGYLVGRYRLPPTADEPADSGKYLVCLRRQTDGAWKLTADIWNSSGEADADGAPAVTEPRSVSRLPAPRFDGPRTAGAPSGADTGVPRSSEPPA